MSAWRGQARPAVERSRGFQRTWMREARAVSPRRERICAHQVVIFSGSMDC